MTFEERLTAILADDVPPHAEPVVPVEPDEEPAPRRVVVISALGGRPRVEVDEEQFRDLVERAVDVVVGPDLSGWDLGRLISIAKNDGPAVLLDALLRVRAPTTLYRVRNQHGRPWRANPITIAQEG